MLPAQAFTFASALQIHHIDLQTLPLQLHPVAIGQQDLLAAIEDSAQLAQRPAKGAARIVGDLPQELAQALARVLLVDEGKVAAQRPRLARRGERQLRSLVRYPQVAHGPDFNHSAVP